MSPNEMSKMGLKSDKRKGKRGFYGVEVRMDEDDLQGNGQIGRMDTQKSSLSIIETYHIPSLYENDILSVQVSKCPLTK